MQVVVLANRADPEAGYVGDRLVALGARLLPVWRDDPTPSPAASPAAWPGPDGVDLVLSLGSDWSVYWEHVAPAVEREADYLRTAVDRDVPVLGLCFGAQVLAHALGGRVERAPTPEIGWFRVDSDRPDVLPDGPYLQWHADRFSVPPGATELARSPVGPQAFALGRAVGLQFHPEATPAMIERWAAESTADLAALGIDPHAIVTETRTRAAEAADRAAVLVDAFLSGALGALGAPPADPLTPSPRADPGAPPDER